MTFKIGSDCKLYAGGAEVKHATDVTFNPSSANIEIKTRGTDGWYVNVYTGKRVSIDFDMVYDADDRTAYNNLKASLLNQTPVQIMVRDPLNETFTAYCIVDSMSRKETDPVSYSVSCKLAAHDTPPVWA